TQAEMSREQQLEPLVVRTGGWRKPIGGNTVGNDRDLGWIRSGFDQRVAHKLRGTHDPVELVWGYDTSSLSAFRRVKPRGTLCVLEQTVGDPPVWNRLLVEERRLVDADFDPYPRPYPEHDMRKVESEIALADRVVCASQFVRDTLIETG